MSENPPACSQEKRGEFFILTTKCDRRESGERLRRTQTYFWQFLILVDASQAPILNSSAEFIQGNSLCSQGHKGVGPETAGQQSRPFYLVLSGSRWGKAQIFQGETKAV